MFNDTAFELLPRSFEVKQATSLQGWTNIGVLSCTTFWVTDAAPSSLSAKESFNLTPSTTQPSIMLNRASLLGTDDASSSSTRSEIPTKLKGGNLVSKGLIQVVPPHVEHLLQAQQLVVGLVPSRRIENARAFKCVVL